MRRSRLRSSTSRVICHPFVKGTEHGASVRSVDLTSSSAEMPVARRRFLLVSWGTSAGPTAHRLAQVGARRSFVQRSGVGFVAQRAPCGDVAVLRILLEPVVTGVTAR